MAEQLAFHEVGRDGRAIEGDERLAAATTMVVNRARHELLAFSTGPYAFVRHPMYFGSAFYFIGTALLLGSWWGVIFAFVLIGLLCIRIPIEEKALRAGLEDYDEYAAHVRYRLIPHVW